MESSGFVQDQVADSCDHNNKLSESRKGITFLNLEVCHPHCVGSITKIFCVLHVQSNTTIVVFDCTCNTQKFFVI